MQRAAAGQVQVVFDHHDRPRAQAGPDRAGGRGQDDGAAPGGDAGAHRVHQLFGCVALVEMATPAVNEDPPSLERHRPALGPVPPDGERGEKRQGVERQRVLARSELLGGARKPRAQDEQDIVVLDPDAPGQLPGAACRPIDGIVHAVTLLGCLGGGRAPAA